MDKATPPSQLQAGKQADDCTVPAHVAIIMDGNGRWAEQRGLPRLEGHRLGTQNVHKVLKAFASHGVRYVTLFAFSTENWNRPNQEVQGLMAILQEVIENETATLHRNNIRLHHLGRLDRLTPQLCDSISRALELTKNNTGLTLSVAFDYGGRDEIIEALKQIVRDGILPERIDEQLLRSYLFTRDLPDPDLIVRTAGEQRLSNFLLWESAYSEYYTTAALWPDFDEEEIERALEAFHQRKRRFGTLAAGG